MISFILCLAILIAGYFIYGKFTEAKFGPDDRETPATTMEDGVDYVVMPQWRIFLIQLLNIAGLGPIWGAVGGAMWGPAVFLWITFGTIFAGAVHDFASGFMSMRHEGQTIAELCGTYMGTFMKYVMRVFSIVLLFMVGVVFAKGPAGLLAFLFNGNGGFLASATFWLVVVFVYFFIATFLSVDKIIGKFYPVFGFCLIAMAVGVGCGIFVNGTAKNIPELWSAIGKNWHPAGTSVWPGMFISVACGAISGFHSTQSPIMARCCKSERQAKSVFYGAMVCEGIIALVWAAASIALFNIEGGKMVGLQEKIALGQSSCVYLICETTMGKFGAVLAMLGVIACPITSGDTAFRSARLGIADWMQFDQKKMKNRLILTVPLLGIGVVVSQLDYTAVWNYFASTNQILAMIVLWTASMYLVKTGKSPWICVVPATFMSAVTMTFVMGSNLWFGKVAFLAANARIIGLVLAVAFLALFLAMAEKAKKETIKQ